MGPVRALHELQADTARLPHFDVETKQLDPRHRWFVERYGRRCWVLDGMDPNDLRARVRMGIVSCIDWPLWKHALEIEEAEVELMKDFHKAWRSRVARGGEQNWTSGNLLHEPPGAIRRWPRRCAWSSAMGSSMPRDSKKFHAGRAANWGIPQLLELPQKGLGPRLTFPGAVAGGIERFGPTPRGFWP